MKNIHICASICIVDHNNFSYALLIEECSEQSVNKNKTWCIDNKKKNKKQKKNNDNNEQIKYFIIYTYRSGQLLWFMKIFVVLLGFFFYFFFSLNKMGEPMWYIMNILLL